MFEFLFTFNVDKTWNHFQDFDSICYGTVRDPLSLQSWNAVHYFSPGIFCYIAGCRLHFRLFSPSVCWNGMGTAPIEIPKLLKTKEKKRPYHVFLFINDVHDFDVPGKECFAIGNLILGTIIPDTINPQYSCSCLQINICTSIWHHLSDRSSIHGSCCPSARLRWNYGKKPQFSIPSTNCDKQTCKADSTTKLVPERTFPNVSCRSPAFQCDCSWTASGVH